jgi:phytoene synthase
MPLSPFGERVRRHDPDRFLCTLFAPPERRETLFLLYAFNHELARAREVTSQPTLALIRLQWWREIVEGARRRHELAGPLGEALDAGRLDAAALGAMIDGREAEADAAIPTLAAWKRYVDAIGGALAVAAGRALGAEEPVLPRLRALGTAYAIAGQLRSVPALARQGRCQLPEETLAAHALTVHEAIADPHAAPLRQALHTLADHGRRLLCDGAGRLPRSLVAAALPAVLARRDLARIGQPATPRGLGDRLAVVVAGLTGRV